jgi:hypothetical protein
VALPFDEPNAARLVADDNPIRLAGGCAVMPLFIRTLIAAYAATKHANPVLLDEHGRPIVAETR